MAVSTYLEFEKPVADLEKKIAELEAAGGAAVSEEVGKLREKAHKQLEHIYSPPQRLAENAGRAPSRAAALSRLRRAACSRNSWSWRATASS